MKMKGYISESGRLTGEERGRMFGLLSRHFEKTDYDVFHRDLAEKEWVILLRDQSGIIQGFSTMILLTGRIDDVPVKALFSGDTIVDKDHWGSPELATVWGRFALSLIDKYKGERLFWFLICQGYRTYRFLPLYFREFYPRHDRPFPLFEKKVRDSLAKSKFGEQFDPATGIIHMSGPQYRLRPGIAHITRQKMADPHIRFFSEMNPHHEEGDEMACIAPLSRENFRQVAYRVIFRKEAEP
jgi:hypothetical protein